MKRDSSAAVWTPGRRRCVAATESFPISRCDFELSPPISRKANYILLYLKCYCAPTTHKCGYDGARRNTRDEARITG